MPESQSCLAHIWWDSAHIESPGSSESVSGSVIEDTPAETTVHLHGQVPAQQQQLDGVGPVVAQQLVAEWVKCLSEMSQ